MTKIIDRPTDNKNALQLEQRAYRIISELIPHVRDLGILPTHQALINAIATDITDSLFNETSQKV